MARAISNSSSRGIAFLDLLLSGADGSGKRRDGAVDLLMMGAGGPASGGSGGVEGSAASAGEGGGLGGSGLVASGGEAGGLGGSSPVASGGDGGGHGVGHGVGGLAGSGPVLSDEFSRQAAPEVGSGGGGGGSDLVLEALVLPSAPDGSEGSKNLSFPAIFPEAAPVLNAVDGDPTKFKFSVTEVPTASGAEPGTYWYFPQGEVGNVWQADNSGPDAGHIIVDEVDLGDALESARITPNRFVRLELSLYQQLSELADDPVITLDPVAEYGSLNLNSNWQTVNLSQTFTNPVVVASDPSLNGVQPAAVRVRNVDSDSFEIRIQEPAYLDGVHFDETVGWMVLEAGDYELSDGTRLSAGTTATNLLSPQGFETVNFSVPFLATPTVLTQVQTFNGADWVVTRTDAISGASFDLTMQEEEALLTGIHAKETIGWLAIDQGNANDGDTLLEASTTPNSITHNPSGIGFSQTFGSAPALLAKLSSFNGSDTANLRFDDLTNGGFSALAAEEQSLDQELKHLPERASFLALDGASGTIEGTDVDAVDGGRILTLDVLPGGGREADYSGGDGTMTAYTMTLLSGQGPDESQGTRLAKSVVPVEPDTTNPYEGFIGTAPIGTTYESDKAAVYGATLAGTDAGTESEEASVDPYMSLVIQKIPASYGLGVSDTVTGAFTWNGSQWIATGEPLGDDLFNLEDRNFGPELNIAGKEIMGASGRPFAFPSTTSTSEKDTYIITFAIEDGAPISFNTDGVSPTLITPTDGRVAHIVGDNDLSDPFHNGLLYMIVDVPSVIGGGEELLA